MSSIYCKAKAKKTELARNPLTPRTWLAEAQDTALTVGTGLWPSLEQQQQDSECACVYGELGGGMLNRQPGGDGLQLTNSLCPSIVPRAWSSIRHLAPGISPTSGGGLCSGPFHHHTP